MVKPRAVRENARATPIEQGVACSLPEGGRAAHLRQ